MKTLMRSNSEGGAFAAFFKDLDGGGGGFGREDSSSWGRMRLLAFPITIEIDENIILKNLELGMVGPATILKNRDGNPRGGMTGDLPAADQTRNRRFNMILTMIWMPTGQMR